MTRGNGRLKYKVKTVRRKVQRVKTRRKVSNYSQGKGPVLCQMSKQTGQKLDQTDHFTAPIIPVPQKHSYISIRHTTKHALEVGKIVLHHKASTKSTKSLLCMLDIYKKVGKQKLKLSSFYTWLSQPAAQSASPQKFGGHRICPRRVKFGKEVKRVCVCVCAVFMAKSVCVDGSGLQQQTA